jgi:hypothetical protein
MTTKEFLQTETSNETVRKLKKHPFNVFPEMTAEENMEVRLDIQTHGYDCRYPIILHHDMVLDGWNRQKICEELCVVPTYLEFEGDDQEAMDFIWRSNKRRNLTSSQWSAIATEAQPIMEAIQASVQKEKAEKLEGNKNACKDKPIVEQIPPSEKPKRDDSKRSVVKLAKQFNTNPKYVAKAKELSICNPEVFKQVKNGELTINDVIRAEKTEVLKTQKKNMEPEKEQQVASNISVETTTDAHESLPVTLKKGKIELVLEISEDLLIKLLAYAKTQNSDNQIFDCSTDHIQTAIILLTLGVDHPTFENDAKSMKIFRDEIQRLNEEYRFPESFKEGQDKDKTQESAIKPNIHITDLDAEKINLVPVEFEETNRS